MKFLNVELIKLKILVIAIAIAILSDSIFEAFKRMTYPTAIKRVNNKN